MYLSIGNDMAVRDGSIILLHDRLEGSGELLKGILDLIRRRGYSCDRSLD